MEGCERSVAAGRDLTARLILLTQDVDLQRHVTLADRRLEEWKEKKKIKVKVYRVENRELELEIENFILQGLWFRFSQKPA